jgi:hypothetical protein
MSTFSRTQHAFAGRAGFLMNLRPPNTSPEELQGNGYGVKSGTRKKNPGRNHSRLIGASAQQTVDTFVTRGLAFFRQIDS